MNKKLPGLYGIRRLMAVFTGARRSDIVHTFPTCRVPLCLTTVVGAFHISLMGMNRREVVTQFCREISQEDTIFEVQGNCRILGYY
jgi:hypothetical protein